MPSIKTSATNPPILPSSGIAALLRAMGLSAVQVSSEVAALLASPPAPKPTPTP